MVSEAEIVKIIEVLKKASVEHILPRYRKKSGLNIRVKTSQIDLVTQADELAEAMIYEEMTKLFPSGVIVGEEACEKDADLLTKLATSALSVLIDPLDGTLNFAQGLPLFGCMVSLLEYGKAVAGVIYDPVTDLAHVALRGGGAWIYQGETRERLTLAGSKNVSEMTIGLSWGHFPAELKPLVVKNLAAFSSGFHFRTAAHEYKLICESCVDVLCYYRIKPWDHAGGALLVQEAGGHAAHFDGEVYSPLRQTGGILVATNLKSWQLAHAALFAA